jgi:hypothetical protein
MLISTQSHMQETMKRLKHDKEMSWSERFQDDIGEHRPGTAAVQGRKAYQPIKMPKQTAIRGKYDAGNGANSTKSTVKSANKPVEEQKGPPEFQGNMQILKRQDIETAPIAEEMKTAPENGGNGMAVDLTHSDEEGPRDRLPTTSQPMREGVKLAICRICENAFTSEDGPYQCPGACRCRYCIIESFGGKKVTYCKWCSGQFPAETHRLIEKFKRCHTCHIAVPSEDMEPTSSCQKVCKRCVVLALKPGGKISYSNASCRCSPAKTFNVESLVYKALAEKPIGACCERATDADPKLSCGHPVCKIHAGDLKFCRSCQRST